MDEGMATYVDPLLIERGKGSKVRYENQVFYLHALSAPPIHKSHGESRF